MLTQIYFWCCVSPSKFIHFFAWFGNWSAIFTKFFINLETHHVNFKNQIYTLFILQYSNIAIAYAYAYSYSYAIAIAIAIAYAYAYEYAIAIAIATCYNAKTLLFAICK